MTGRVYVTLKEASEHLRAKRVTGIRLGVSESR